MALIAREMKKKQKEFSSFSLFSFLVEKGVSVDEMDAVSVNEVNSVLTEVCTKFGFQNTLQHRKMVQTRWKYRRNPVKNMLVNYYSNGHNSEVHGTRTVECVNDVE